MLVVGSAFLVNAIAGVVLLSRYSRWTLRGAPASIAILYVSSAVFWFGVTLGLHEAEIANDIAVRSAEIERKGAVPVVDRERTFLVTTSVGFESRKPDGSPDFVSGLAGMSWDMPGELLNPALGMAGVCSVVVVPLGWVFRRKRSCKPVGAPAQGAST